ncbi:MAG: hypothetical protein JO033_09565 [Acidobacteriaceae bacterium]|nr:hypothetical protein [Acidobacteriaceae bacterium]MBV9501649.1 hypothetical protein [Acidobacteriaceae bacterium]
MQPPNSSEHNRIENKATLRYSHQSFRPEAVEAYATRQAGEPWDARHRLESWMIAVLTVVAAVALAFVFAGGQ